jgi:hypothetical protein
LRDSYAIFSPLPEDDFAETEETFSDFEPGMESPKTIFNLGGQDYGIISERIN